MQRIAREKEREESRRKMMDDAKKINQKNEDENVVKWVGGIKDKIDKISELNKKYERKPTIPEDQGVITPREHELHRQDSKPQSRWVDANEPSKKLEEFGVKSFDEEYEDYVKEITNCLDGNDETEEETLRGDTPGGYDMKDEKDRDDDGFDDEETPRPKEEDTLKIEPIDLNYEAMEIQSSSNDLSSSDVWIMLNVLVLRRYAKINIWRIQIQKGHGNDQ